MLRTYTVRLVWICFAAFMAGLNGCAAPAIVEDSRMGVEYTNPQKEPGKSERARSEDQIRKPITTKYAYFEPAQYQSLPGWSDDKFTDAWQAFQQSCKALNRRSAWNKPCARSARVDPANDNKIRAFIESEFDLYQIHDVDRKSTGVVTGYYEPIINGSRIFGGRYTHPIYGVPNDLLFIDARTFSMPQLKRPMWAYVQGRDVKVVLTPVEY